MQWNNADEYYNKQKYDDWSHERSNEYQTAKEKISLVLIEQKISLSEARVLLNDILDDIERNNPITKI